MHICKTLLLAVLLLFVLSVGSAFGTKDWTFMVYLAADNNLEGPGVEDLNEMEIVGSTAQVDIVVQMDRWDMPGHPDDDASNGNWTGTRRYYVTQDSDPSTINSTLIQDMGEQNMGDPNVLKDFVNWAMSNYPANKYCLVLWDHGSGWQKSPRGLTVTPGPRLVDVKEDFGDRTVLDVFSKASVPAIPQLGEFPPYPPFGSPGGFKYVCSDDASGDHLGNDEIQQVLGQVAHLDVLGFDACLMNMVETAYEVRSGADYMVGSEELEQGDGWPYDAVLQALTTTPTMTARDLSVTIVQKYREFCEGNTYANPQAQSAIELAQAPTLKDRINEFAQAMIAGSSWTQIQSAAQSADRVTYQAVRQNADIYHFAHLVATTVSESNIINAANNVKTALSNAVVSEFHQPGHPNFHGLAIYLPTHSGDYKYEYAQGSNIDFPTDTQWDEFLLQLFAGGGTTTDTYEPNDVPSQAHGPLVSGQAYQSYLPSTADIDGYFISFGVASNISASLMVPGGADFDLYLQDTTLAVLRASETRSPGADESFTISAVSPGTYYVVVQPYGSSSSQPYTLTVTYSGGNTGTVMISYDDGEPEFAVYMTGNGDAMCMTLSPPTVPMKLEGIFYNFPFLDAFEPPYGDGSFYLFLTDPYGYLIDPYSLGQLTPGGTGWCWLDLSSYNIGVYYDIFAGLIYDGWNTACVGYDTAYSDRSWYWVAGDQWYPLGYTLSIRAVVSYVGTDVEDEQIAEARPHAAELLQNYPNPFNPETRIDYFLPQQCHVKLAVFNVLGKKVRTLVDEFQLGGRGEIVWDGRDENGQEVTSGVYFYSLQVGEHKQTRKMLLLR